MTRAQRLRLLAIAAVLAIVAVVVLAGGAGDPKPRPASAPKAGATRVPSKASPRSTATPAASPVPLLSTAAATALMANQGDTVRFRVRSDTDEEVHVHGYDLSQRVKAGQTIAFAFKADITGIFAIEFEKSGTQLASLKVLP